MDDARNVAMNATQKIGITEKTTLDESLEDAKPSGLVFLLSRPPPRTVVCHYGLPPSAT